VTAPDLCGLSPFVWFLLPVAAGLAAALALDLWAYLTGRRTLSQVVGALGTRRPWVRGVAVAAWVGLGMFLYLHFWGPW
jgi:hypothetical protein